MGSPKAPVAHEWGSAPNFVGPRHELRERLLLDLFVASHPGPKILNVGAGQGSFTELLEARGYEVMSTDLSPAFVEVLENRVRGEVVRADLTELPLPDGTFDGVVAGEVLEHIEAEGQALSEVARVLRPGGVLVLSVPAHPEWFGASDRWAGHVRRYTHASLVDAIGGAGLELVRVRPWGFPMSALYHRLVYDRRAADLATDGREHGFAKRVLGAAVKVDQLFVGVERGCLGYLAVARTPFR